MSSLSPDSSSPPPPSNLFPFVAQVTPDELSLYAAFLARDFGFDRALAEAKHVNWYRGVVGADTCSPNQAVLLRDLTIAECATPRVRMRPRQPDPLRDFARPDVNDDGEHRGRRARFMAMLTGRVDAGIAVYPHDAPGLPLDVSAAIDAEFERAMRETDYAALVVAPPKPLFTAGRIGWMIAGLLVLWAVAA